MVNALYSSRDDGTKYFQLEWNVYGWQAIIDLYLRECELRNKGAARTVPRLREIHLLRDSWTKLNVHPAKIMQVYLVLVSYSSGVLYLECMPCAKYRHPNNSLFITNPARRGVDRAAYMFLKILLPVMHRSSSVLFNI